MFQPKKFLSFGKGTFSFQTNILQCGSFRPLSMSAYPKTVEIETTIIKVSALISEALKWMNSHKRDRNHKDCN